MENLINLVRIKLVEVPQPNITITSPSNAANIIGELIRDCDREIFVALLIDIKNNINSIYEVSVGSLNNTIVHPREVFKAAILANASGIILGHNHPSGDCTPSSTDIKTTKKIYDCGNLLGIEVLDHIIVGTGSNDYYSFKENQEIIEGV